MGDVLNGLPLLADRPRCAVQKSAMKTRLDDKEESRKLDERRLEVWKKAVRLRDKNRDRYTGKKVVVTIELQKNRAECHHVTGRAHKPTRYDRRNGLLVSLATHQAIERGDLLIVGTKFFELEGKTYIDADFPVVFKKMTL